MLTRRVTNKPRYELFGSTSFSCLPPHQHYMRSYQLSSEIVELACTSFMQAVRAERPMSMINGANTYWIAYYWRNLPIEAHERILLEDSNHIKDLQDYFTQVKGVLF